MSTAELRNKILHIISNADAQSLKRISDFLEISEFEDQYVVSDTHKQLLDKRLENHKQHPTSGKDWNELNAELSAKYDL